MYVGQVSINGKKPDILAICWRDDPFYSYSNNVKQVAYKEEEEEMVDINLWPRSSKPKIKTKSKYKEMKKV